MQCCKFTHQDTSVPVLVLLGSRPDGGVHKISTRFEVNPVVLQTDPWVGGQRLPRPASSAWLVLGGRSLASILPPDEGWISAGALSARPCK